VPLSAAAFATLPQRYRNEGTAMFSLVRNVGSSIGISIVMTFLGHEVQVSHAGLGENINQFSHSLHGPGTPQIWNLHSQLGLAALDGMVNRQAVTIAYLNDFLFMMAVTLAALPLAFLLKMPPKADAPAEPIIVE
jgi:DHA2 family multidrug resistance protein